MSGQTTRLTELPTWGWPAGPGIEETARVWDGIADDLVADVLADVFATTEFGRRWQDEALCSQVGGDLWFPEKGEPTREAKRVCGRCPVRAQCLEYALAHDERFGVWGGLSERERRRLRHTPEYDSPDHDSPGQVGAAWHGPGEDPTREARPAVAS